MSPISSDLLLELTPDELNQLETCLCTNETPNTIDTPANGGATTTQPVVTIAEYTQQQHHKREAVGGDERYTTIVHMLFSRQHRQESSLPRVHVVRVAVIDGREWCLHVNHAICRQVHWRPIIVQLYQWRVKIVSRQHRRVVSVVDCVHDSNLHMT